jgi:glutaminyl-peptide cyclotransferase
MPPAMTRRLRFVLIALAVLASGCGTQMPSPTPGGPSAATRWVPEIVERVPHDPSAWTQGLVLDGGRLYESTGRYGDSALRELDRDSGALIDEARLEPTLYGEGLALVGDRLLQLTWREEVMIAWDRESLIEAGRIGYDGEGWGLCHDGEWLVMSDGTASLAMRDPETFEVVRRVTVVAESGPVTGLNELECVDGLVYANVWPTNEIVIVEPTDGAVVSTIDATALAEEVAGNGADVLNGIAHDPERGTFLLTGKLWPTLFEVRLVEAP